jgi:hypothetical protein
MMPRVLGGGMIHTRLAGLLLASVLVAVAHGGASKDDVDGANDPLSANVAAALHDQFVASRYGRGGDTENELSFQATLPHRLGGVPQLLQATIPIVTSPEERGDRTSGLGDIELQDIVTYQSGSLELGLGPVLTFPSATDDRLGDGKWQAGATAAAVGTEPWGILAAIVTYQHSFANDGHRRPTQNELEVQPFVTYDLPDAFYLRSTAMWTWDLQDGSFSMPFGLGAGKVWKLPNDATLNAFVEPQYTVAYEGDVPQWQVFAGVELQLAPDGG